jgi:hypothetical protein
VIIDCKNIKKVTSVQKTFTSHLQILSCNVSICTKTSNSGNFSDHEHTQNTTTRDSERVENHINWSSLHTFKVKPLSKF